MKTMKHCFKKGYRFPSIFKYVFTFQSHQGPQPPHFRDHFAAGLFSLLFWALGFLESHNSPEELSTGGIWCAFFLGANTGMSQRSGTLKPIKNHGFPCWNKVCWMQKFVVRQASLGSWDSYMFVPKIALPSNPWFCCSKWPTLDEFWIHDSPHPVDLSASPGALPHWLDGWTDPFPPKSQARHGAAPASLFSSDELLVPQAARPAVANLWNHFFEQPGGDLQGETILQSQVKGKGRTAGGRWLLEKRLRQKWSKTGPTFVNHSLSKYHALLKKLLYWGSFWMDRWL